MELPAPLLAEFRQASHPTAVAADKRAAVRHPTSLVAQLHRGDASGDGVTVVVRDISQVGLSIIHSASIAEGEAFTVVLPRSKSQPLVVDCIATRWCPFGKELFVIGARYERIVSPS